MPKRVTTNEPCTVFRLNYLGDKTIIMQITVGNQDEIIDQDELINSVHELNL